MDKNKKNRIRRRRRFVWRVTKILMMIIFSRGQGLIRNFIITMGSLTRVSGGRTVVIRMNLQVEVNSIKGLLL